MQNYPVSYYGGAVPQNTYNQPLNSRYNRAQGCIIVNLVSNIKEAEAFPPDPLNPIFFYNMAQNEIYMKQFNNMGQAPLYVYKCSGEYSPAENAGPIIADYDRQFSELNTKIDNMTALLSQNVQPVKQITRQTGGKNAE